MNYKVKQEWLEAVMASDLSPATKVYAYGIFQHMYGNKDSSWPGAKALTGSTGLNDSQFYKYNKALVKAGYLEVTPRKGRSNEYVLSLPTSTEGEYPPQLEVYPPSEEVTPTSTEGTNTTKKTVMKTTREDINEETVSDEPVEPELVEVRGTDSLALLTTESTGVSLTVDSRDAVWGCGFEGTKQQHLRKHMNSDSKYGAIAAKRCPIKEGVAA